MIQFTYTGPLGNHGGESRFPLSCNNGWSGGCKPTILLRVVCMDKRQRSVLQVRVEDLRVMNLKLTRNIGEVGVSIRTGEFFDWMGEWVMAAQNFFCACPSLLRRVQSVGAQ